MNKKVTTNGKKSNPIVFIVIALLVLAGLYYGAKRWRQQQYIKQLAEVYGGEAGLLSNLTGGNSGLSQKIIEELAKEAAKEEAEEIKEEAKEAAKTPQDKFNETKEVSLTANSSSIIKSTIDSTLKSVFGSYKLILFSGNYLQQGDSYLASIKVPRAPTSQDMNKIVEELTKNGYVSGMNIIEADSAHVIMEKDGNSLSVYYEDPDNQEITVLYVDESTDN